MKTMDKLLVASSTVLLAVGITHCGSSSSSTQDLANSNPDMTVQPDLTSFSAPIVLSVTPPTGVNNLATPITIAGTNFRAGVTVTVGGAPCGNPVVTANNITCTAPAKAVTCGIQTVVVTNSDAQSATSATGFTYLSSAFTLGTASPSSIAVPTGNRRVASGDFNIDGKLDLVTLSVNSNNITMLLGNGDGTFQAAKTTATGGTTPTDLAVADVNGDAKLDIVVIHQNAILSTFLGNGDGTFQAVKTMASSATGPLSVALADLNSDQLVDVVVPSGAASTVYVLLGNGNGTYLAGKPNATGGNSSGVALANLNGDTKLDIALSSTSSSTASVLLSNGDGTFAAFKSAGATVTSPYGMAAADVTGDGNVDLVVTSNSLMTNNLGLLAGNGDGTFAAQKVFTAGNAAQFVWLGDMNGDGLNDAVVAGTTSNNVVVLTGIGPNGFSAPFPTNTVGMTPAGVTVGLFNSDKLPDVVSADFNGADLSILLQQCK